jgi:ubiquinone/menaquinone biosynthesis C-methylase UbiE
LLCADILSLPLRAASFDKIFSIHTFYFWQQSPTALDQLYRLLAPGGRLVLTMATAKKDPRGRWVYWPLQAVLEQEVLPAMQRAGFRESRLENGPDSREYNNVALIAGK